MFPSIIYFLCYCLNPFFFGYLTVVKQQRVTIQNSHGEKLVGIMHETGSTEIVIVCHGFRSSKVGNNYLGCVLICQIAMPEKLLIYLLFVILLTSNMQELVGTTSFGFLDFAVNIFLN